MSYSFYIVMPDVFYRVLNNDDDDDDDDECCCVTAPPVVFQRVRSAYHVVCCM